jgi:daunorubicin resistance ABC transporter membrane protein
MSAGLTTGDRTHRSVRSDRSLIAALVRRDLLRLRRDTGRWMGLVLQPLLLWALLGSGFGDVFKVPGLDIDYHRFFFPGLVVMVGLFTAIFATMAVIEDRDHGFLQQVLVSPASRFAMVTGKVLGVLAIALAQFIVIAPAATLAGYDLASIDLGLLTIAYILGVSGMTALAFALAWVCQTTHAYHAIMGVLLIPLWLVSGSMFPIPASGWLHHLCALNPLTYAVDALRHGFEGGHSALASTTPLAAFAALLTFVALAMTLATWVSRASRAVGHGGRA